MIELYSLKDVSKIFSLHESRLRYWMQIGFVGATVKKGGRFFYTFADLVAVKAAKDLLAAGLSTQKVRKNIEALRKALPPGVQPASKLRICSDGETIVAIDEDVAYEPSTKQIVMAFEVPVFARRIAEVVALGGTPNDPVVTSPSALADALADAAPNELIVDATERNQAGAAVILFRDGCAAEDRHEAALAEHLYRQALELDPTLAPAMTNLGNIAYGRGDLETARGHYERALDLEPSQAEARYNFANLLEDLGETELAIAEMRRVCSVTPDFADAHYNLGMLLTRVGGVMQARQHLSRYLELDTSSEWAGHARGLLQQLAA